MEKAKLVGDEFVRLYYKVMNTYAEYLYLFYEEDSSVVVSESQDDDKPLSIKASTRETVQRLLCWMYGETSVSLIASVPQISVNGSLLLLNSGKIMKKNYNDERFFTQALFLARQNDGFYVKTDTIQVLSRKTSFVYKLLPTLGQSDEQKCDTTPQKAGKPCETKHQPNDSCFERHLELDPLDERAACLSNKVPIVCDTPRQRHGNDISVGMSLPEITEGVINPTTALTTFQGKAAATFDSNMRLSAVVDDDARPAKAEKTQPGSVPKMHRAMNYTEPVTPASHGLPPFTTRSDAGSNTGMPELTSLFAARLPLDITPAAVGALFSAYGRLQPNAPIRVFTGPTNCYACISFQSEADMRAALNSDIRCEGSEIITEVWRPRDRRGRRTGREHSSRTDACRPMYRRS